MPWNDWNYKAVVYHLMYVCMEKKLNRQPIIAAMLLLSIHIVLMVTSFRADFGASCAISPPHGLTGRRHTGPTGMGTQSDI